VTYVKVALPAQRRETRVVKDLSADEIAREIVGWITSD
jgi:electron transfer flavoprotein beta subunit